MRHDLALRFDTEAAAIAALEQFRATDMDGKAIWMTASHGHALDPIGLLGADERFHVNLQTDDELLAAGLQPHAVFPLTRRRVWA